MSCCWRKQLLCWARVPRSPWPFALLPRCSPSMPALCLTVLVPQLGLVPSTNPLVLPSQSIPAASPAHSLCAGVQPSAGKKFQLLWASDRAVNVRMLLQQLVAPWLPALRRKGAGLGMFMRWREHLVCWERPWWGRGELDTPIALF